MLHSITNITEMNREIELRSVSGSMLFDCGSSGPILAEVAFVGEAPGEREQIQKTPFCGNSGKMLWDALRGEKLNRNQVYATYAVKRRIDSVNSAYGNKGTDEAIKKPEKDAWKHILADELSFLPNLKFVVAMGNYAIEALVGETNIHNWRGSVLPIRVGGRMVQCLCINNPAILTYDPKSAIVFKMDLRKLTRLLQGTFTTPHIEALINPTVDEALAYIRECEEQDGPIATDIETMANETACVGLAYEIHRGMCINFRSQGSNTYTTGEESIIRHSLQRLFSNPTKRFVAQNGNFDSYWLYYKDRLKLHGVWLDTMLAHHWLYPPLPHGLGFLTAQYTDHPYYKDEGKLWKEDGDIDQFWVYNVKDCCITLECAFDLIAELEAQDMSETFFAHVMRLQPHLVEMTVNGVLCDVELKSRITTELELECGKARELCQTLAQEAVGDVGYSFNPRSPTHLRTLFFSELKLVGRGPSTDKVNRDRMRKHPKTSEAARRLIDGINEYLREAKFLSTYANSRLDPDNKFRCEYKQTGVVSAPGRLSSSQVMWGNGLNLQNIPERAKPMFLADKGYEFSYFDLAQVEARIVAWIAEIDSWQIQFERARLNPGTYDAHKALASEMYGVPYEQLSDEDWEDDPVSGVRRLSPRGKAKRCRHGLNYRMGPDVLATTAGLTIAEAEATHRLYHRTTPEIEVWWADTVARARRDRKLYSVFGRRWILMEAWSDEAVDSIIAFEPQSTAGDHVARVMYLAQEDKEWPRGEASIKLNIHDALIAMNRPQDGECVRAIMKKYAEMPLYLKGKELIVPADFGVSIADEHGWHRWSTIKKIKPAKGLVASLVA